MCVFTAFSVGVNPLFPGVHSEPLKLSENVYDAVCIAANL